MKQTIIAGITAVSLLGGVSAATAADTQSPFLSFAQAEQIAAKAEAVITGHKLGGVVVIVDASGRLIMLHKLDGALLANIELAQKKAYTAVAFGMPTEEWIDRLSKGNYTVLGNPEVTPLPGGMPIKINGTLVGAIGVATPQGPIDTEAAGKAVAGL
jgi:uncharacterized protein GlcG (DUF336 family)